MMNKIVIKSDDEIAVMIEGGKRLRRVKEKLSSMVVGGTSAYELEEEATKQIEKLGGKPSFKMVPGYSWSTCVNINSGIVHGIPKKTVTFKKGDVVSVDVGMYYNGFHTDTSFSLAIDPDPELTKFMDAGKEALSNAIKEARVGNYVYDLSNAMESTFKKYGVTPIEALVGHGVGRELHEAPQIPCFTQGVRENTPRLVPGMVIAIEAMYAKGKPAIKIENDGWTISMRDDKISALYEDTVAITAKGTLVLT